MRHFAFTAASLLCVAVLMTSCSDSSSKMQTGMSAPELRPLAAAGSRPPAVGEKAMDFALQTLHGDTFRLSRQLTEGPVVVLVLRGWPGYQCPICTRLVGQFLARGGDLNAAGAQVVLIYPGPAERLGDHAREFSHEMMFPPHFTFVTDPDYVFTQDYGLRWEVPRETAYPSTFVIDREGIVRFAKISHTHGDRADIADVLAALSAATPSM